MTDHLHAEFAKLWTSAQTPPDVVKFLGSLANPSPKQIGAIVKLDQQCRWKTAAPMTVEDYLNAVGEWRNDQDVILEFTAGEFLARLDVQHLPHVGEYAARFPHLESQIRQKLSDLSTNGTGNTSMVASIRESLDRVFEIDDICDAFGRLWRESPTAPFIEAWVLHGRREERTGLLKELLRVELCVRVERKEAPTLQEYRQRFADESPFRDILNDWEQHPQQYMLTGVPSTKQVSPQEAGATLIGQFPVHSSQSGTLELDGSQRIGHFRLLKQLGRGTFGRVYRAHDEQLERAVAIKVPRRSRFRRPEDAEAYLAEARTVARLDHPGIVPVYQAGRSDDGAVYVVSRLIEGRSLEEVIKNQRPDHPTTAQLVAKVARALHFAHQHRVIHRDIKPANILIDDATGTPFVADFGLAMKEEDYLKQAGTLAGTPAYMSPEQARAEGHRLDGRSDLFALGVVLYELLTGKRPFRGSTANETLYQVISVDPHPPRSIDETIPAELERICLKAISKRTSDRYASGELMAGDLEAWLKPVSSPLPGRKTDVQVVPKGLRSFDANDADFFLDLLPGQRTRDGLPESVAFWKERIEQTDPEQTFTVGLIYGPSGCGKSSLVKAGLLPHLSKDVIAVYLEATPEDTELRILRGLRKRVESLDSSAELQGGNVGWTFLSDSISTGKNAHPTPNRSLPTSAPGLTETILHLRRGQHQKIVIIIDQFEQWLHAHRAEPDAELVRALRQCDGVHVQAIVMIRDDFAMAAARFMQALDVSIVQGQNFATVDLFEIDHAKNVLLKFGQAFGKLPANRENLSADENQFVSDIAHGLSQDSKVVSVRLSLFAEMIKTKRWMPETLQAVGGTEGIGVNFLEETFSSPQANPRHRLHATAARAVLRSLLPDLGSDIKGHMRSQQEVLEASGYQDRPTDFTDLLRILDGELRLITPTDPEGDSLSGDSSRNSSLATRYYQLTHDYLVPSLRDWLTRKQRETRKGRAELKLEERSAIWNAKRENRHLPSLVEWLSIRSRTEKDKWNNPQRRIMQKAGRLHVIRTGSLLTLLVAASFTLQWILAGQKAASLVEALKTASPEQLTALVQQADENPRSLDRLLQPLIDKTDAADADPADHAAALPARLVLAGRDSSQVKPLSEALLSGDLAYVAPIRTRLRPYASELRPQWLDVLRSTQEPATRRFRAALGLASLDGDQSQTEWSDTDLRFIAEQLASSFAEYQPQLRNLLRPIGVRLVPSLDTLFDAETATEDQKINATMAVADYAGDDAELMAQLLTRATARQTEILYPKVVELKSGPVRDGLLALTKEQPDESLGQLDRVRLGRRRANAAITLLRQGERDAYFDALRITDDPESLSQFVARCQKWSVTPTQLIESLQRSMALRQSASGAVKKIESRVIYGLLLALGSYSVEQIPEDSREALFVWLLDLYEKDPSAAIHSASGWLLRHWGTGGDVQKMDEQVVPYDPNGEREWFRLRLELTARSEKAINNATSTSTKHTHCLTFIVFPAAEYRLGSPEFAGGELDRQNDEVPRVVKISRPLALCDREVTWALYDLFDDGGWRNGMQEQWGWDLSDDDAVFGKNWYDWVEFCRWLTRECRGDDESWQCYPDTESLEKDGNGNPIYGDVMLDRGGFRMPTESEWELGSRSGQRTAYGFGSDVGLLGEYGWFQENSEKRPRPTAVKPPTVGGLFDAQGNLYEWTHDWNSDSQEATLVDPQGASAGSSRVFRGGSWNYVAAYCRSAFRFGYVPTSRSNDLGFRLALSFPSGVSSPAEPFQAK